MNPNSRGLQCSPGKVISRNGDAMISWTMRRGNAEIQVKSGSVDGSEASRVPCNGRLAPSAAIVEIIKQ